ncbi:MAG: hypothetical protein JWO38_2637 [Gemmataceae bacterium]|nr:hypothetical protein [Gemmataceae bacterium]
MCHLYLYVEGQTEQTFADTVLKPHLAQFGVYLMGAVLAEFGRKKGKVYRGGVTPYDPFRRGLANMLKQHDRSGVVISTMVDLYALLKDFPGWEEADGLRQDPRLRVARLEERFAADVGNPRFVPYIQLHEFEAMLFADPGQLALFYHDKPRELAALQMIADAHTSPELIDDGKTTAPSERIIAQLPDYEGAKPVGGPQVAELIGLDVLRAKCQHFSQWVERLEELGQAPAPPDPTQA